MSMKKSQVFTAEQKSKIVLELIKEDKTVSQLASQYLRSGTYKKSK